MPEFLERRYNKGCRSYLAAISLISYVFTKISVSVYAGALVLETILGWKGGGAPCRYGGVHDFWRPASGNLYRPVSSVCSDRG
ncbi:MAG: hypothetical protein QGH20_11270 [Candidatus Latescibacteria bacterium]|nr:hypothetical protein [Candidatus Latescibacterota bacterium]